jgi:hypothetical protein
VAGENVNAVDAMRGYLLKQVGMRELRFDAPGEYVVDEATA